MRKLLSFGLGIAIGAVLGGTLMILIAPSSGDEFKRNLKLGYEETLEEARQASVQRRLELEAKLARMRGQGPVIVP
jgi:gas vesicle protein